MGLKLSVTLGTLSPSLPVLQRNTKSVDAEH